MHHVYTIRRDLIARLAESPSILYWVLEHYRHPATARRNLLADLMHQRDVLVAVATGHSSAEGESHYYRGRIDRINQPGAPFGVADPSPFHDLRAWQEHWKAEGSTSAERRRYIESLYEPVMEPLFAFE